MSENNERQNDEISRVIESSAASAGATATGNSDTMTSPQNTQTPRRPSPTSAASSSSSGGIGIGTGRKKKSSKLSLSRQKAERRARDREREQQREEETMMATSAATSPDDPTDVNAAGKHEEADAEEEGQEEVQQMQHEEASNPCHSNGSPAASPIANLNIPAAGQQEEVEAEEEMQCQPEELSSAGDGNDSTDDTPAVAAAAAASSEASAGTSSRDGRPKPSAQQPTREYMQTPVNRDELAAFKLRTRLTEMKLYDFWTIMQHQNWRHLDGKYYTPQGQNLGSSIEAFAYLDRFGMPRRGGGGQAVQEDVNSDEARRVRKLRDDLLEGFFRYKKYNERKKRKKEREKSDENGATTKADISPMKGDDDMGPALFSIGGEDNESPVKKKARGGKKAETAEGLSIAERKPKRKVTEGSSIDVGAQQYLEGARATRSKSKGAKQKDTEKKQRAGDDGEEGHDDEPDYHVWPDPEANVTAVRDYATEIADNKDDGIVALDDQYYDDFAEWKFLLSTNHALLLYGFGSKRSLLNDFAEAVLPTEGDVLTLDGFDRTINIDEILTVLVQLYLGGHEPRPRSSISREKSFGLGIVPPTQGSPAVVRRALAISERIAATRPAPLYLVLHNIDGVGLRYRNAQDALAILVAGSVSKDGSTRMIRLASSVDQVNASAMLWTTQTRTSFAWIWKEVHTYRPCFEEVRLGFDAPTRKTRYGAQGRSSTIGSMGFMRVLQSLGPRHVECLQILARLQLKLYRTNKQVRKNAYPTIAYQDWKGECLRKMCANNDSSLRLILTEMTDHGIVVEKKDDQDGTKHLYIPHPDKILSQIIKFDKNADIPNN